MTVYLIIEQSFTEDGVGQKNIGYFNNENDAIKFVKIGGKIELKNDWQITTHTLSRYKYIKLEKLKKENKS